MELYKFIFTQENTFRRLDIEFLKKLTKLEIRFHSLPHCLTTFASLNFMAQQQTHLWNVPLGGADEYRAYASHHYYLHSLQAHHGYVFLQILWFS